ncbi:MAG: hypothetical protein ACE5WD_02935 [Candidatus Aminicenantia bacterium]
MKKLSLEIKAPCPCPLAMNFIKNILKKMEYKLSHLIITPGGFQ